MSSAKKFEPKKQDVLCPKCRKLQRIVTITSPDAVITTGGIL